MSAYYNTPGQWLIGRCRTNDTFSNQWAVRSMTHKWHTNDTPMIHQWHTHDTPMTHQCHTNDTPMTHQWHTNDTTMTQQWHNNDIPMTHQWHTNDTPMTHQWHTDDTPMTHQWHTNDTPMTHQWHTSDTSMTHQWHTNDALFHTPQLAAGLMGFRTNLSSDQWAVEPSIRNHLRMRMRNQINTWFSYRCRLYLESHSTIGPTRFIVGQKLCIRDTSEWL